MPTQPENQPVTLTFIDDPIIAGEGWLETVDVTTMKKVLEYMKGYAPVDNDVILKTKDKYKSHYELVRAWRAGATQHEGRYWRKIKIRGPHNMAKEKGAFERAYHTHGVSLATMRRDIRGALCNEYYVDIDLRRAAPRLLGTYCARINLDVPALARYLQEYDIIESELAECADVGVAAAKRVASVILNGGDWKDWCFHHDVYPVPPVPEWVSALKGDVETIWDSYWKQPASPFGLVFSRMKKSAARSMCDAVKENWAALGENRTKKVGLNLLMQNLERQAIEHVFNQFSPSEIKHLVYAYDGFMMPKQFLAEKPLSFFNSLCQDESSPLFNQEFVMKPFETGLNAQLDTISTEGYPAQLDMTQFDVTAACQLETYEQRREYFETFFCKIADEASIAGVEFRCNDDGLPERQLRIVKTDMFAKEYPEFMKNMDEQESVKKLPITFFTWWHNRDTKKRRYKNRKWIPFDGVYSNMQHSATGKNLFNTFMGYSDHILSAEPVTAKDRKNFDNWRKIVCQAVGGSENFRVFTQLIAHKVKDPTKNLPYSIIIRSRQGEGKDTCITALSNVIGRSHVLRAQQLDSFNSLGGTGALANRLLVQVNECAKGAASDAMAGAIKAWTTDAYIQVRELYKDPRMAKQFGLWIFTSNNLHVLTADTDSGERRFFVFQGTGLFAPATGKPLPSYVWADLHNGMEEPGFIYLLYNWLTEEYDPGFAFDVAKAANTQTEAYQRMMGSQRREELFWLQDFLESKSHVKGMATTNVALTAVDAGLKNAPELALGGEDSGMMFHEHPSWRAKCRITLKDLHRQFRAWGKLNSLHPAEHRALKDFELNLTENLCLPLTVLACKAGSEQIIEFTPARMYYHMFKKYMMFPKEELAPELKAMAAMAQTSNIDEIPLSTSESSAEDEEWEVTDGVIADIEGSTQ